MRAEKTRARILRMPNRLERIIENDPKFGIEAYLFVFEALAVAQKLFKHKRHVTGKELLEGIKALAHERYGRIAKSVLNSWGVHTTDDFGTIVFHLVNAGLMSKTTKDRPEDFHAVYDFDQAFIRDYHISDESHNH